MARWRKPLIRGLERAGARLGFHVVGDSIYSPVVRPPSPGDPIWEARSDLAGVLFDLDEQMRLVESMSAKINEFGSEVRAADGFELWNGFYQAGDAEILYAMIRKLRPSRVLELGSGFSTLVTAAACARNIEEGSSVELVAVDPQPRTEVRSALAGIGSFEERDGRELDLDRFRELGPGDVLFVDTSHAVKLGSEVNWLVLEVLPRLRRGVHVHFHDVFLPHEYPRYVFEFGGQFNEQYLIQAFLIGNSDWEVTLALATLALERRQRLAALLPSIDESPPGMPGFKPLPAAFWMRRR